MSADLAHAHAAVRLHQSGWPWVVHGLAHAPVGAAFVQQSHFFE
jgi:hypothetical protein